MLEQLIALVGGAPQAVLEKLARMFLSPGSASSIASLLVAAGIAAFALSYGRRRGLKLKVLIRALFPRRIWLSRSSRLDLAFFIFNSFLHAALFGWAVVSSEWIRAGALGGLQAVFGVNDGAAPVLLAFAVGTVVLFLAAELSYYTIHSLLHRVPFLWAFHQAHHSAEVLTPATNFRVHPVETIGFANLTALIFGLSNAVLDQTMGARTGHAFFLLDRNVLGLLAFYALAHLQHSHLWIVFPGWLGRWFYSPAHHQIHHSTDPAHFGTNLGSFLLIFDRLFGTHYPPPKTRPAGLTFGVEPIDPQQQTIAGAFLDPFIEAARTLRPAKPAATVPEPAA